MKKLLSILATMSLSSGLILSNTACTLPNSDPDTQGINLSDVMSENSLNIKIITKDGNFTGIKDNFIINYIKPTIKTQQDTIYIDKITGTHIKTNNKDLTNIDTTEIIQIGFYKNNLEQIQVVQMPKIIEKVPNQLPPEITNMSRMFFGASKFNQDLSKWNVSNVTNMSDMFFKASVFNQDLSKWNVSNVTNMSDMFYVALKFNQDLSKWDVSNVMDMSRMFYDASKFNQDLSKWNVSKVINHTNFSQYSGITDSNKLPKF